MNDEHLEHVLLVNMDGVFYRLVRDDIAGWIGVDLDGLYDRPRETEQYAFVKERGWEFRVANVPREQTVGHVYVTRFFFPPHDPDNAMLFKLTWGGVK